MGAPKISGISIELLKKNDFFSRIPESALGQLAAQFEIISFSKGDPLILEKEKGDHVYILLKGSCDVLQYSPHARRVQKIGQIQEGALFSEYSILGQVPRTASIYALEKCECARLDSDSFLKILKHAPEISQHMCESLAFRYLENIQKVSGYDLAKPEDLLPVRQIYEIIPQKVWKKAGVLPLSFDGVAITYGTNNPDAIDISQLSENPPRNIIFSPKILLSSEWEEIEKKLLSEQTKVKAWVAEEKQPTVAKVDDLKNNPLFKSLPQKTFDQLKPLFRTQVFKPGEMIVAPGTGVEELIFVASGKVGLYHPQANQAWTPMEIHSFFGAVGLPELLTQTPASFQMRSIGWTQIFFLKREVFVRLLGSPLFTLPLARCLVLALQRMNDLQFSRFQVWKQPLPNSIDNTSLPLPVMLESQIVPLDLSTGGNVLLGVVDPTSDDISRVSQRYFEDRRVVIQLITPEFLQKWSAKFETKSKGTAKTGGPRLLETLLEEAMASNASDFHLESQPTHYSVRIRVDGVLRELSHRIDVTTGSELVNRMKVMAGLDISNRHTPQDGQFKLSLKEETLTTRTSILPTKHGEKAVLRLIRGQKSVIPLEAIAPDRRMITMLKSIVKHRQGLFLITGPTGSGKTTTLYSMIDALNHVGTNITTIEDPVELEVKGVNQVEVNTKQDLTFACALRSMLRQDPDVIMVGEIRDRESAQIVFEAAMTGHLVLSTLHANDSLEVPLRLSELGVTPHVLASGLLGSLAQRLVRQLCKDCRQMHPIDEDQKQMFTKYFGDKNLPKELAKPVGCSKCANQGYKGRVPIYEIWNMSSALKDQIASGIGTEKMRELLRPHGFETLQEFGLKMAALGLTTIEEVERVLGGL